MHVASILTIFFVLLTCLVCKHVEYRGESWLKLWVLVLALGVMWVSILIPWLGFTIAIVAFGIVVGVSAALHDEEYNHTNYSLALLKLFKIIGGFINKSF